MGKIRHWLELSRRLVITRGRYGLSSKEFTPAMVRAVFDSMPGRLRKPSATVYGWDRR